ncbi:FkbM family methyltransferase [Helicobacter japonicus]|uniref:FkbM family methyltransferase n=12 Tax=Helicobacter japonicus TaxID=425400 RepID=A0A4U8TP25_9HELI|nr:FkbM family methyltransferase [Helicobacter japonicus]
MVDVGSNIGDTCCFVGLNDASYLLCEGEKSYANLIAKNIELNFGKKVMGGGYNENTKPQFLLYECFLGDKMGHYTISLRDGSGTLQSIEDKGNTLQDFESVKIRTLDSVIAETHFAPHFIKIDTDGFDFKVLRGAKQTLTENQSVLFFEWDKNHLVAQDENPLSIFSLLNELGYKELLIFDNFGTLLCKIASDDSTNLALLIDYTLKSRQNIYYYDVLTFHKDSLFNAKDYINFTTKGK